MAKWVVLMFLVVYFKQKTAYEMRISDWSSDVCSSDLLRAGIPVVDISTGMYATSAVLAALLQRTRTGQGAHLDIALLDVAVAINANQGANFLVSGRSEARRVGNECVGTCRSRWSPDH